MASTIGFKPRALTITPYVVYASDLQTSHDRFSPHNHNAHAWDFKEYLTIDYRPCTSP